jgi:hypothetical protein
MRGRIQHGGADIEVGAGLQQHATELAAAENSQSEVLIERFHACGPGPVTGKRRILPPPAVQENH